MMGMNHSGMYYEPRAVSENTRTVMNQIDEVYTDISSTDCNCFMQQ